MQRIVTLLVVGLALVARAEDSKLVAVMPLGTKDATLSDSARVALEESIRTKAGEVLRPLGLKVLTSENTLRVMRDNGVSDEKCARAECAVDLGRELKARYIISGTATTNEGNHSVFIRLFDVTTGEQLSSIKLRGKTGTELEDAFDAKSRELFDSAGLVAQGTPVPGPTTTTGPKIASGKATEAAADLTIDVKPRELARLEITDPSGKKLTSGSPYKNPKAQPGRWHLKAVAEGFDVLERDVSVPADEATLEKVELVALGGLDIKGTPEGAAVQVTSPKGDHWDGGLPWAASGLPTGEYGLSVRREGYVTVTLRRRVEPGRTATVEVKLEKVPVAPVVVQPVPPASSDAGPMVTVVVPEDERPAPPSRHQVADDGDGPVIVVVSPDPEPSRASAYPTALIARPLTLPSGLMEASLHGTWWTADNRLRPTRDSGLMPGVAYAIGLPAELQVDVNALVPLSDTSAASAVLRTSVSLGVLRSDLFAASLHLGLSTILLKEVPAGESSITQFAVTGGLRIRTRLNDSLWFELVPDVGLPLYANNSGASIDAPLLFGVQLSSDLAVIVDTSFVSFGSNRVTSLATALPLGLRVTATFIDALDLSLRAGLGNLYVPGNYFAANLDVAYRL